jgi:hypothetical protein
MSRSKDDIWLLFKGTDIQKYLVRKGSKAVHFAENLNVSPPTLNRWSTGSAPPSGPSVLILAILLRGQAYAVLQDHPPAWWRHEGQKKRGGVSKSVGHKPVAGSEEDPKEDLFQFLLEKGRVQEVAVSPRGMRCAEALVESLSESLTTWRTTKYKSAPTNRGHLLGSDGLII